MSLLSREQARRKEHLLCEIGRKDGIEQYNKQKYNKALHLFNEALRHVPDDVKGLVYRSKCYLKLRRTRRAIEDVDTALHVNSVDREALLQKADVLDQSGNHEMALVYYHRGLKHYPRAAEFKEGIARAEKRSIRTGRRMKMTATGDITYFTQSHKKPAPKRFSWKQKEKPRSSSLPSADFRSRQVHPLVKFHRTPSIHLSESRATSINSLLAGSLESLAHEGKLVEDTTEKDALGKLYEDKEYLEFLVAADAYKNKKTPLGKGKMTDTAVDGLDFLYERTKFWDSLGPLPPPHPSRASYNKHVRDKSRLSHYTSTESLNSVGTYKSTSSLNSCDTTATRRSKPGKTYRSRYAFGKRKEKPIQPNPEKVKFEFASYQRDDDLLREMTEIPEECTMTPRKETKEEIERQREASRKRGEEVMSFMEKELKDIEKFYAKSQLDQCKKRADTCVDILGRYTEEEVTNKHELLATLYSCLGNCDMHTKNFHGALENHGHVLDIGEQFDLPDIQSRALGNLGRVHVVMGKYNRALDLYNRKAPLCKSPKETAWLFHEIGNCFLMMKIFEYAYESGMKAFRAANESGQRRLQMQTSVLIAVAEVNLMRYKEAYQHFETALEHAKLLEDKRAQDAMTRALVDVNKKIVHQMKKKAEYHRSGASPVLYNLTTATPVSRATSSKTNVTVDG